MIGAAAAYLAGSFFASFFETGKAPALIIAAAAVMAAACLRMKLTRKDIAFLSVCFASAFSIFMMYTAFHYDGAMYYSQTDGSFTGTVSEIREYENGASYVLKGKIDGETSAEIMVYFYDLDAEYGDIINIGSCRFSAPKDSYLYKSNMSLRSQGIFLQADKTEDISVVHTHSHRLKNFLMRHRSRMTEQFRETLGDDAGSYLAGMIFGEKQGLDDDIQISLYRCGIGHILAVSGLHVSVAALFIMGLMKLLGINRYVIFALTELFLAVLVSMANSPVSARRAAVMMTFLCISGLLRRRNDTFNSLSAAVLLICVLEPYAIYSGGFLLSAAGTFGIGVFAPYMTNKLPGTAICGRLLRSFAAALCVSIIVTPLSIKYFGETSLISPFVNTALVPLCTLAMVIGMIHVFTGGMISVIPISGGLIRFVISDTDKLSRLDIAHFSVRDEKLLNFVFICAAAVIAVQILFSSRAFTAIAAAAACAAVFTGSLISSTDLRSRFTVAVLGDGANATVIVSLGGRSDVIDLCGRDSASQYVEKYLSEAGICDIGSFALTRGDTQQEESFSSITDNFAPQKYISGSDFSFSTDEYYMSYEERTLTVNYHGYTFVFAPAGEITRGDMTVCYGGKNNGRRYGDIIFLGEDLNNFEMTLPGSGVCQIRRL